jgi:DNA-binding MarR family transcriptional regulator
VQLTPQGQRTVDGAMADLLDRERSLLAELPERDRAALAGLLRRLLTPFEV